jgi:pimeloyl-ACP methyl ester carboxylesterase
LFGGGVGEPEDGGSEPVGGERAVEVAGALAALDEPFEQGGCSLVNRVAFGRGDPGQGRVEQERVPADTIRRAARTGFTRPVDIPDALIEHMQGITYRSFTATMRAYRDYIRQRSIPDRLAALGLPVLVIFGADDQRWRSSSAADYRIVPGVRVELLPGVDTRR